MIFLPTKKRCLICVRPCKIRKLAKNRTCWEASWHNSIDDWLWNRVQNQSNQQVYPDFNDLWDQGSQNLVQKCNRHSHSMHSLFVNIYQPKCKCTRNGVYIYKGISWRLKSVGPWSSAGLGPLGPTTIWGSRAVLLYEVRDPRRFLIL